MGVVVAASSLGAAFRGMDDSMQVSATATALFAKPAGEDWSGMSVSDVWDFAAAEWPGLRLNTFTAFCSHSR